MQSLSETAARILEIETRQDDALRQLAELEQRLDAVLAEYLPASNAAKRTAAATEPTPSAFAAAAAPAAPAQWTASVDKTVAAETAAAAEPGPPMIAGSITADKSAQPKRGKSKRSVPSVKAA